MRLNIPTGIDLTGLNRIEADTSAYLLHMLIKKSRAAGSPITSAHNLHRDILYTIGGKGYRRLVGVLEDRGILSVGSSYSVGRSSKQYQIARLAATETYEVTDPLVLKRIRMARSIQTKYTVLINPHLQGQLDFIKSLTIDAEATARKMKQVYGYSTLVAGYRTLVATYGSGARQIAEAYINNDNSERKRLRKLFGISHSQNKWLLRNSENYRKLKKRLIEVGSWAVMQQDSQKDQWLRLKTSNRTGRLFSNVTGTPKDVRKELRYNGKPLVELDASSAQWAMLVYLLSRNTYNIKGVLKSKLEITTATGDHTQVNLPLHPTPSYICVSLKKELELLGSLVSSGEFNAYMHNRIVEAGTEYNRGAKRSTPYKIPVNEKATKHLLICRVLFENPSKKYLQEDLAYIVFRKEFPAVMWWIEYLKTGGYRIAAGTMPVGDKPYSSLALRLQRMEAEVFVHLLPEYTSIPHCTIHDAVLVPEEHIEAITSALKALISDYGLPMRLK